MPNKYLVKIAERTFKEHAVRYGKKAVRKLSNHIESTIMGATLGATGGYLKAKAEEQKKKIEERRKRRAELRKQAEEKEDGAAKKIGKLGVTGAISAKLTSRLGYKVDRNSDSVARKFSPHVGNDVVEHLKRKSGIKKVYDSTNPKFKRTSAYHGSFIYSRVGKPTRVYAAGKTQAIHELGHAVSMKNKVNRIRASGLARVAPSAGAVGLLMSGDKEKAKYAPGLAAAGTFSTLLEEANANRHAYKALKHVGGKGVAKQFAKKVVPSQMLGHAIHGAAAPLAAYGAYKWIYRNKGKGNKHLNKAATMLLLVEEDNAT